MIYIGTIDMTMSLYLFLDMYLHSGEYHRKLLLTDLVLKGTAAVGKM